MTGIADGFDHIAGSIAGFLSSLADAASTVLTTFGKSFTVLSNNFGRIGFELAQFIGSVADIAGSGAKIADWTSHHITWFALAGGMMIGLWGLSSVITAVRSGTVVYNVTSAVPRAIQNIS